MVFRFIPEILFKLSDFIKAKGPHAVRVLTLACASAFQADCYHALIGAVQSHFDLEQCHPKIVVAWKDRHRYGRERAAQSLTIHLYFLARGPRANPRVHSLFVAFIMHDMETRFF